MENLVLPLCAYLVVYWHMFITRRVHEDFTTGLGKKIVNDDEIDSRFKDQSSLDLNAICG